MNQEPEVTALESEESKKIKFSSIQHGDMDLDPMTMILDFICSIVNNCWLMAETGRSLEF